MAVKESQIQDAIRLELGRERDLVLWPNPCGQGIPEGTKCASCGAKIEGRRVKYGVGNPGGSDLVGTIRTRYGVAASVFMEVKSARGAQRPDQGVFENCVRMRGAEYVLVRSPEEARTWFEEYRRRHG